MIVRLFEMIKSSRPFQDACHIVAEQSTLQLPMWQEMHKSLLCRSSQVHPTTTIVARNGQRVTEPLPANTVSFLGWPTTFLSLAIWINCKNVSNELILIECPCRHWCHMKFSIHQSYQFTLPIPMWQEMRKGLLCPIRFDHFTSILNHEMCRGSMSHCRPTLWPSLAGQLQFSR